MKKKRFFFFSLLSEHTLLHLDSQKNQEEKPESISIQYMHVYAERAFNFTCEGNKKLSAMEKMLLLCARKKRP